MEKQYIEHRGDGYWIADSRVSLDSVIGVFRDGYSPETIAAECFPTLSLEQVYGGIAFYLGHRRELDAYLRNEDTEFEAFRQSVSDPDFSRKIAGARRELQAVTA